jgi:hypothetical protein
MKIAHALWMHLVLTSFVGIIETIIMNKVAQQHEAEAFKVLRAVNPAILGGTQPLQIAKDVQFPNAAGGLRLVSPEEIRALAHSSAQNLLSALALGNV